MENISLEYIKNVHDDINNDSTSEFDKFCKECSFLKDAIIKFFSQKSSAEEVRDIYRTLDNFEGEKKIACFNIYDIYSVYKEYLDGMIGFIEDVINLDFASRENLDVMFNKLNTAKANDSKFLEALMNGQFNSQKEMPLREAICNLDYLVDVCPKIEEIKNNLSNIKERAEKNEKNDLIKDCLNMLFSSVRNYFFIAISEVIKTFESVKRAISENNSDTNMAPSFTLC